MPVLLLLSARALLFGQKLSFRIACLTFFRVFGDTRSKPFITLETVAIDTPAFIATLCIVGFSDLLIIKSSSSFETVPLVVGIHAVGDGFT